jgi:hypothetical protein
MQLKKDSIFLKSTPKKGSGRNGVRAQLECDTPGSET